MQTDAQVTGSVRLQIPSQPSPEPVLLDPVRPVLVPGVISPEHRMERNVQPQTPQSPRSCGSAGGPCGSLDMRVTAILLTLAGAVILLLLYRLLQLRHRLKVVSARHALQYHGFYRTATYTFKHPAPTQDLPLKNGTVRDATLPVQTVTTITPLPPPPPPEPGPPPPLLPPPPLRPPPALPETPPLLPLPLPLPVIHTTPPSPHLSWGACSDVDVYSRIGTFRASRLSSLSNQSKVILFEHSSF
ncbi:hypothetical protein JOB18_040808 [Solea senegalensis]|uniref:Uncharacterized protein n=1 Tax=Solea senegalensis TaxID=28829 RepID=A0AAV6R330_SOLSE|nr:serine/threonine-protein kinase WNK2 [Solea senegalensis]KAG7499518.1 hypothetical protein JOB18_040808 [Solea senegalensis]